MRRLFLCGCAMLTMSWIGQASAEPAGKAAPCLEPTQITSGRTPEDLYPAIVQCLREERYSQATLLHTVAQAYAEFDRRRAERDQVDMAIAVLHAQLWQAPESSRIAFAADVKQALQLGSARFAEVCGLLRRLGPPTYETRYWERQGTPPEAGPRASPRGDAADAKQVWQAVLESLLHCPSRSNRPAPLD
ncbi:MAG: hypothetical protein MJE66_00775 [Proteobacteria bacterium]|nr:hypothetical protein [Pseudomonadota bacterium]